mmetsp:Transcript_54882/g.129688  ORF Transcript_54882/g.129688 Transcript_54882/m.129688 type:complete len:111 (+) Transcript_54882:402-734(+)
MTSRAIQDNDWISNDEWEIRQSGWTRTRFVLERFHRDIKKHYGQPIKTLFLCGGDVVETFEIPGIWARADVHSLLQQGVVAITRDSVDLSSFIKQSTFLAPYEVEVCRPT